MGMQIYLLCIRELLEASSEQLNKRCLAKLDGHRLGKILELKAPGAIAQSIGAGLLLQLAVQSWNRRAEQGKAKFRAYKNGDRELIDGNQELEGYCHTVSEILEILDAPEEIAYTYDEHGKPDFADKTWHFNLSHSGDYVCLVTDNHPIGVDIQQMRPLKNLNLAEKYFSKEELAGLKTCADSETQEECFYRIWVRKEAYAKLTGEGIARMIRKDTNVLDKQVKWMDIEAPEGYCIAACQWNL